MWALQLVALSALFIPTALSLTQSEKAIFYNGVEIVDNGEMWTITSKALPDHATADYPTDWNPNTITEQNYTYNIAKNPVKFDSDGEGCLPMGPIGITVNGVPLYHPYSSTGANAVEGDRFDNCDGHPDPFGQYHYHKRPSCVLKTLLDGAPQGTTDVMMGISLDGFPIYASLNGDEEKGKDLDNCNGKTVNGQYRYYATKSFPYLLGCYRAIIERTMLQRPEGTHALPGGIMEGNSGGGRGPPPGAEGRGPPPRGPPPGGPPPGGDGRGRPPPVGGMGPPPLGGEGMGQPPHGGRFGPPQLGFGPPMGGGGGCFYANISQPDQANPLISGELNQPNSKSSSMSQQHGGMQQGPSSGGGGTRPPPTLGEGMGGSSVLPAFEDNGGQGGPRSGEAGPRGQPRERPDGVQGSAEGNIRGPGGNPRAPVGDGFWGGGAQHLGAANVLLLVTFIFSLLNYHY